MRKFTGMILAGVISATLAIFLFNRFSDKDTKVIIQEVQPVNLARLAAGSDLPANGFVEAAAISTPAVVHIQTSADVEANRRNYNPFWEFFGEDFGYQQPRIGSGSGVIISSDGYIVTNNHVVEGADEIQVTLNDKKEFKAKMIGTDPTTDIAVIKIEEKGLAHLKFGNSDDLLVGEWVLAVGNPFNLASTVTAGIVSAKGRNINILREKAGNIAIESFIQTDAAVNPGNSGGAMVDTRGNLVGINTAIATPTGTFAGYSFAVPSNLVKKVVEDIKLYGVVQRGFMGVSIADLTAEQADEMGLDDVQGVYISEIVPGSGADDAGLKPGDVITHINATRVKSSPELQELVGRYRPGDALDVDILRNKNNLQKQVVLKTRDNQTDLLTRNDLESSTGVLSRLGGVFEDLTPEEARDIGIRGGVRVKKIREGILSSSTQMKPGFIITKVNNRPVYSLSELEEVLQGYRGDGVLVEGRYPGESSTKYYAFGM